MNKQYINIICSKMQNLKKKIEIKTTYDTFNLKKKQISLQTRWS